MKNIKAKREEENRRYSAIDRHNDFLEEGYETKRKSPFIGRVAQVILTDLAKNILENKTSKDKQDD